MADLFGAIPGATHGGDPVTSHEAAVNAASMVRWDTERRRILSAFDNAVAPLTADEAGRRSDIVDPYSGRRRCSELKDGRLIEVTCTVEQNGRKVSAYRITDLGRSALTRAHSDSMQSGAARPA
jgi:hypothetical protein